MKIAKEIICMEPLLSKICIATKYMNENMILNYKKSANHDVGLTGQKIGFNKKQTFKESKQCFTLYRPKHMRQILMQIHIVTSRTKPNASDICSDI
jgi:hypothetical protein